MDSGEIKEAIGRLSPEARRELLEWLKQQHRPAWVKAIRLVERRWDSIPGLRRAVLGTLIGLIGFVAVETAIFDSGWYSKYLEPDSRAAQVEYNLFWLQRAVPPKVPDVLVVGDSRIAEGFSTRIAEAATGGRLHFINMGMPGASPRVIYYALRDAEKNRKRFSAIVIPLDRYSDRDEAGEVENNPTDLSFLAGRLRLSDCWDYSRTYTNSEMRRDVLTECLIRGLAFRPDVQAFLANIPERLKRAKDWRNNGAGYVAGYGGKPEDLRGLTLDATTETIHFPPGVKDWQIGSVRAILLPSQAPQTGALTAYRRRWIGGILDLYKNSATRIIFFQLPNAPLPLPEPVQPARFIDSVKARPRLTVLPVDLFRHLQKPEWFADGLHLNGTGRRLFSVELANAVAPIVEAK